MRVFRAGRTTFQALWGSLAATLALACSSGAPGRSAEQAEPVEVHFEDASGERGHCAIADEEAGKLEGLECEGRTLPGTGHSYCVKAHPDCKKGDTSCFVVINFNMGDPSGLGYTYQNRVTKPAEYGKFIAVGAGTEVDSDVMAELPRAILREFPGADANRIYALGNSRGAGSISAIAKTNDSKFGTTWDIYAAAAIFGGRFKNTDVFEPTGNFHLIVINGWDDVEEPDGVRPLAAINDCENPDAEWRDVESSDPLMEGGDGTDIAQKLTFGDCQGGDVVAYRFKDEGHVVDFNKNFDPKVRALNIAWDFFQGRTRDDSGIKGNGSACYQGD